jgi:hypothetical protein
MPPKPKPKPSGPVAKKPPQGVQVYVQSSTEATTSQASRIAALEERLAKLESAVRAGLGLNF